jgi:hypothetical protein
MLRVFSHVSHAHADQLLAVVRNCYEARCSRCSCTADTLRAVLLRVHTITVVEVCCLIEGVVTAEVSIPHMVDNLVKHDKNVCSTTAGRHKHM